jgi:hypothetical protein
MKKIIIFFCITLFLFSFISSQNETNESFGEANQTIIYDCGNGILEGNESCDYGEENGILCSAEYGEECKYCTEECLLEFILGGYCGDEICDSEENFETCSLDCSECETNEDCNDNNDCTEDNCVGNPKKCENLPKTGQVKGSQYCKDGQLTQRKEVGSYCNDDYECLNNNCKNSKCSKLEETEKDDEDKFDFLVWILEFLKSIFS